MSALDSIRNYVNQVKGVAGIGDEALESSKAIKQNIQAQNAPAPVQTKPPYDLNPLTRVTSPHPPIKGEHRIPDATLQEWMKPLGSSGLSQVRK